MATILDRIVSDTRQLISRRKRDTPLSNLEGRPLFDRSPLSLAEALSNDGLSFIAETKRASPSAGVIREKYDPASIAQGYAQNGAAAVSVLTEPLHFQGSLEQLAWVRAHVELPLLRKDFVVDPYQLVEAKAHGADAVLLIAAILGPAQLTELLQTARELGLSVLVEVHALNELDKIDFDYVEILGANNRNLETFEIDLNQSIRVFRQAPEDLVRVTESGLKTADELATMHEYGMHAVLIGTTLMKADDPGKKLGELREATSRKLGATATE